MTAMLNKPTLTLNIIVTSSVKGLPVDMKHVPQCVQAKQNAALQ